MALGPWYVGDSPTADIVVSVTRDDVELELDGYTSAAVLLYNPLGAPITWGTTPTIDTAADTVAIPPPSASPFATAGQYQLHLRLTTASGRNETMMVDGIEVLAVGTMPTVALLRNYLRDNATSWLDADLQEELDAEAAAQRRICRPDRLGHPDVRKALRRRVQRALALRGLPLAVPQGDIDTGRSFIPSRDPEVRQLEAPHRRLPVG